MSGELKMKLYEDVAEKVITLIRQGTLKNGEKVPSIRTLSSDLGVSINTVKEAYMLLENKNYIESRPQSGFYVNNLNKDFNNHDRLDPLRLDPLKVSLCRIYSSQLKNGICPPEAGLAISSVDTKLLPQHKLSTYFTDVFRFHGAEAFNYCMPPGYQPLREQIAIQSVRGGINVDPEEIMITSGCTDGLSLALMAICKPGDTIAIESPMYFNFIQICEELDLKIIEIPNSREKGLSLDTLRFVLEYHNIKAFITIPNFNNPIGSLMSDEQKEELVNLMESYDVPLIEDAVYSELYYTKKRPLTCKSFDKSGNVVLCSSFSKNVAPGLRVGWIIPGKFYEDIERKMILFHLGTSGIPQIALSQFLKEGGYERHNRKLRTSLKKQLQDITNYVMEVFPEGTKVEMPEGGVVLWIECPEYVDTLDLYNKVKSKGILFAPGAIFSLSGKYLNNLRINGGIWNDGVKKAIKYIGESIQESN